MEDNLVKEPVDEIAPPTAKLTTWAARVSDTTKERIKDLVQHFPNAEIALVTLMDGYALEVAKQEVPDFKGDVEGFQATLHQLMDSYNSLLTATATADERIRLNYEAKIHQLEEGKQAVQTALDVALEKVTMLEKNLAEMQGRLDTHQQTVDSLSAQLAETQEALLDTKAATKIAQDALASMVAKADDADRRAQDAEQRLANAAEEQQKAVTAAVEAAMVNAKREAEADKTTALANAKLEMAEKIALLTDKNQQYLEDIAQLRKELWARDNH